MTDENKELLDEIKKQIVRASELGFCQGLTSILNIMEDIMDKPPFEDISGNEALKLLHLTIKEELTKLQKELNIDTDMLELIGNKGNVH